jgi:hypothetical protein
MSSIYVKLNKRKEDERDPTLPAADYRPLGLGTKAQILIEVGVEWIKRAIEAVACVELRISNVAVKK